MAKVYSFLIPMNAETPEELIQTNWKLRHGGHHVIIADFKNEKITAFDYNFKESYFQRFLNILNR
jgi:hypothetical protein